jgi:cytochrome c556
MVRRFLTIFMAVATANAVAMDQEQAEKVTEVRQSVMVVTGWSVVPMAAMAKARIPYDSEEFQKRAGRIAEMLSMVPDAFRPDTREAVLDTEALDKIWEDYDKFQRLAGEARDAATAAQTAAANGGFEEATTAFVELGKACKACHDDFREED